MKRRDFVLTVGGALMAGAALGCGDDGGGGNPDAMPTGPDADNSVDCVANGTRVVIGTNHGHTMTVSKEDVVAGAEKSYNIQGGSAHPHTVVVTAAHFTMLQAGTSVQIQSSVDAGHPHTVTVGCA